MQTPIQIFMSAVAEAHCALVDIEAAGFIGLPLNECRLVRERLAQATAGVDRAFIHLKQAQTKITIATEIPG